MKPRWLGYCYTCRRYHLLTTRKRIRDWKKFHGKMYRARRHNVMLYRIDKFTVVF